MRTATAVTAVGSGSGSSCPQCGNTFGCGVALQSCWCHAVQLSTEALATLRARYDACLCPDCLREWTTVNAESSGRSPDEATATRSGQPPVVAVAMTGSESDQA